MSSLVEELDNKMLSNGYSPVRGKGKALFLGQLNDIKSALDKGYSRFTIWKHLHDLGKMPVGYASFALYVYKYITEKEKQKGSTTKSKEEPAGNIMQNTTTEPPYKEGQPQYSYDSKSDKYKVQKYA